jgi:hypothetical protein
MFSRTKIKLSDILQRCLRILVIVRRWFFLFLSQICSRPIQIHSCWIQISQRQQRSKNPFSYTDDDRRKNTFQRYVFYVSWICPILHMNCLIGCLMTLFHPVWDRKYQKYFYPVQILWSCTNNPEEVGPPGVQGFSKKKKKSTDPATRALNRARFTDHRPSPFLAILWSMNLARFKARVAGSAWFFLFFFWKFPDTRWPHFLGIDSRFISIPTYKMRPAGVIFELQRTAVHQQLKVLYIVYQWITALPPHKNTNCCSCQ